MADQRIAKLAQTPVNYSVSVEEKDLVGIIAQPPATPLVQEVVRQVLRSGGYPITGSLNQSAIHWDMICDIRNGGQILVDGEMLHDSGEFQI